MDRIGGSSVICLFVFGGNIRLGFLALLTPQQVADLSNDPDQRFRDHHVEFLEEEKPLVLVDADTSAKQQRIPGKFRRFTDAIEVRPILEEDIGQAGIETPPINLNGQAEQVVLGVGDIDGLLIQGNEIRLLKCFDEILQETTLRLFVFLLARFPTHHRVQTFGPGGIEPQVVLLEFIDQLAVLEVNQSGEQSTEGVCRRGPITGLRFQHVNQTVPGYRNVMFRFDRDGRACHGTWKPVSETKSGWDCRSTTGLPE